MAIPLKVLMVEDSEAESEVLKLELRRGGYEPAITLVGSGREMRRYLSEEEWDIIVSEYSLPHFTGLEALAMYRSSGLDIPFVMMSDPVAEDVAIDAMV